MVIKIKRIIIMGAAGRDFHNFNVLFRNNKDSEVVAFTAAQIPNIEGRKYPKELSGELYPNGIKIYPEKDLQNLIKELNADSVLFSYSDVSHKYVMHRASLVNAAGADFVLASAEDTMLKSNKPVISVCAVRTGCGKSQTTRKVAQILKEKGKKVAIVRHPMPYGDLKKQICQRFENYDDLDKHECTIEEREEYEPHMEEGFIVYAGIDYEKILREAEKDADIILWDGGNNDTPFFKPDLEIVVVDPLRPGHEMKYYPGETNFRRAEVIVINKIDSSKEEDVDIILKNIKDVNPKATVIKAASLVHVSDHDSDPEKILIIEDGPTLTHGEMTFGAGVVAALTSFPNAKIIEPMEYAVGSIKKTFKKYPHLKQVLPAMGYGEEQMKDLQETINKVDCDLVLSATPIDLTKLLKVNKKVLRVVYELSEIGDINLTKVLDEFLKEI